MIVSFGMLAAQTTTTSSASRHTGDPGYGWIVVVLGAIFLVAAGGFVIAGWTTLRGSFFTRTVTSWQRRVFVISAVSFAVPFLVLLAEFLGFKPSGRLEVLVWSVGIGIAAFLVGVVWVVGTAVRDRLAK